MMVSTINLKGENLISYLDGAHKVLSIVQQESEFNPTTRPWFRNAKPDGTIKLSEPYLFYFLKRTALPYQGELMKVIMWLALISL